MSPVDRAGSVTGMNFALGSYHGEPQALATEIWGKICPPSDQKAIV